MPNNLEYRFHRAFVKDSEKILKRCVFKGNEVQLYRTKYLLQRDFYEQDYDKLAQNKEKSLFGRIDLIFKYKGINWGAEIKTRNTNDGGFWSALKVVGYCAYLDWQDDLRPGIPNLRPAIILPKKKITMEYMIICNKLRIGLFGITENKNGFKMEWLNKD